MPKKTAQIGKADERMLVKDLDKLGYRSRRQPGSGSVATDLHSDVLWFDSPAGKLHIEAKYRENCQWRNLLKWKAGADILTVRCDARRGDQDGQRYALLSWDLLLRLVGEAAERCSMADLEGVEDSGLLVCPNCDGEGTIWPVTDRGIDDPCEQCNGSGRIAPPIPYRYKNEKGRIVDGPDREGWAGQWRGGIEEWRRSKIQSSHQNPPPKPIKPNKLQGRGFSKRKVKADET